MSNVIEIEHLYKEYRLGLIGYGTLREDLQSWWARARGKEDPNSMLFSGDQSRDGKAWNHILALNDINLTVERGERLGIIGANGAGKTTLLKILSRIASPTKGTAKIKGRIASLLAVGTGFHKDLTGRENIYLNGSILGLRKLEIDQRFDEIVDFSGVGRFINTPVKRYSSGMHVRLGFSVAAHLDPDVLIVDEVLAVGDVEFRKKALGKMKHVSEGEGRTILFVSHNMEAITNLCTQTVLLDQGKITRQGNTSEVIDEYLDNKSSYEIISIGEREDRQGNGRLKVIDTWIADEKDNKKTNVIMGQTIKICARYKKHDGDMIEGLTVAFAINTLKNVQVSDLSNIMTGDNFIGQVPSDGIITCVIPKLPLNTGTYTYNIMTRDKTNDILDYVVEAGRFEVVAGDYYGIGKISDSSRLIMMDHNWEISFYGDY